MSSFDMSRRYANIGQTVVLSYGFLDKKACVGTLNFDLDLVAARICSKILQAAWHDLYENGLTLAAKPVTSLGPPSRPVCVACF